jgi:hypothetical protein
MGRAKVPLIFFSKDKNNTDCNQIGDLNENNHHCLNADTVK